MFFNILAGIIIVIGVLTLFSGLRMLIRKGWLLAWMRGMFGLVLLGISLTLVIAALDLLSYKQLARDQSVGTISFIQRGNQSYTASLLLAGATEERAFDLKGDQWQVDARVIRWKGLVTALGAKPGYKLDRLSGRYFSLADERSAERTVYDLSGGDYGIDLWQWMQDHGQYMPWAEAVYGSATFVPMSDGALYEIVLTTTGLAARPMNDIARQAISQWR